MQFFYCIAFEDSLGDIYASALEASREGGTPSPHSFTDKAGIHTPRTPSLLMTPDAFSSPARNKSTNSSANNSLSKVNFCHNCSDCDMRKIHLIKTEKKALNNKCFGMKYLVTRRRCENPCMISV